MRSPIDSVTRSRTRRPARHTKSSWGKSNTNRGCRFAEACWPAIRPRTNLRFAEPDQLRPERLDSPTQQSRVAHAEARQRQGPAQQGATQPPAEPYGRFDADLAVGIVHLRVSEFIHQIGRSSQPPHELVESCCGVAANHQ